MFVISTGFPDVSQATCIRTLIISYDAPCKVQFSSRRYLCTQKSPYALHPVSQKFSQSRLSNGSSITSDWPWPALVLSRKIVSYFLFPHLAPPCDRRCDVLGFVPTGNVSSTSTLHIFREAHYLWGLLCLPGVYLVSHFPSLRRVQGSTPTGVFEGGCRPLTHSSLGFPFHFALFVTSSLNLCGWWHVWSKCQLLRQSSVADCMNLYCQAGGWNRICCAILQGGSPKCIVQPSQDPGSSDLEG